MVKLEAEEARILEESRESSGPTTTPATEESIMGLNKINLEEAGVILNAEAVPWDRTMFHALQASLPFALHYQVAKNKSRLSQSPLCDAHSYPVFFEFMVRVCLLLCLHQYFL